MVRLQFGTAKTTVMANGDDVIVIGAGAAGMAAALELAAAGLSVSILEARDRIGGRIFTQRDRFVDTPIELGAEFNRRVSNGAFPFWGCPVGFDHAFLGPKHHNGHDMDGLAEKRLIDCRMVGAQKAGATAVIRGGNGAWERYRPGPCGQALPAPAYGSALALRRR